MPDVYSINLLTSGAFFDIKPAFYFHSAELMNEAVLLELTLEQWILTGQLRATGIRPSDLQRVSVKQAVLALSTHWCKPRAPGSICI